ncbi:MAG: hypothetical protein U0228_07175 [Myxococcaceae bacterium]
MSAEGPSPQPSPLSRGEGELAPTRREGCPARVTLESASAGDWADGIRAHVDACPHCREQLQALEAHRAAFLAARPTERFLGQLDARAQKKPARRAWLPALGLVATAAVALFVLLPRNPDPTGVNFKGLSSIALKRGDRVETAASSTKLAPGDALRFSVHAPRDGFAVVLERDGAGKVTIVAPFAATAPLAVSVGTTDLPDSAVLDDVRGADTFFTVFSEQPFELKPLVDALERGESPRCPGCTVEVSSFDKP